MEILDSFYTPESLADRLIGYITEEKITTAVDFCVGNGDLLKALRGRFSSIKYYGTDISESAIRMLSKQEVSWELSICDFKSDESIDKVSFLKRTRFDVILLNPPFTCRGSVIEHINLADRRFKVSTAMLFVLRAVKYLSSKGGIYAILPVSCVYSEKDKDAWNYLRKKFNACILEEPERVAFSKKCAPNVVFVYVGKRKRKQKQQNICDLTCFQNLPILKIVRGQIHMQNLIFEDASTSLHLIHTTNLQNGRLTELRLIRPINKQFIHSNGVVIPRVCNPTPNKVVVINNKSRYVLSDCVIFLQTQTLREANIVRDRILEHWDDFASIYKGTGAKYTTIARLIGLFKL